MRSPLFDKNVRKADFVHMEATPRLELGVELLQSSALPLGYVALWITGAKICSCYLLLEQVTRLELATSTLARWRSTR
jgi:hypothetical protein